MTIFTRAQARALASYFVDDALNRRWDSDMPDPDTNVRFIGWQVAGEPVIVAVWSYLPNVRLGADDATEIAINLLCEIGWFADGPTDPDYIF